jgi:hypothetical protein
MPLGRGKDGKIICQQQEQKINPVKGGIFALNFRPFVFSSIESAIHCLDRLFISPFNDVQFRKKLPATLFCRCDLAFVGYASGLANVDLDQ